MLGTKIDTNTAKYRGNEKRISTANRVTDSREEEDGGNRIPAPGRLQ
jgi:hypothetical protein